MPSPKSIHSLREDARLAAIANNQFAMSLWQEIAPQHIGNLIFSPASIHLALALTAAGTAGPTASEMWSTLAFAPGSNYLKLEHALLRFLENPQSEKIAIHIANALWTNSHFPLNTSYRAISQELLSAQARDLDFSQAKHAAKTINAWVKEKTSNTISDIISPDLLDEQTMLVLTNAIYLKAGWETEFDAQNTKPAPFKLITGGQIPIDTMFLKTTTLFAQDDHFSCIDIPYNMGDFSFQALVTNPDRPPSDITKASHARLQAMLASVEYGVPVRIRMPRFKTTCQLDLGDTLQAMGMELAFTNADLTPMFAAQVPAQSRISKVLHKTFIQVDEKGTEAGGATVVVMLTGGFAPPRPTQDFIADRPFLFQIVDRRSGAILFMGQVNDPSK